MFSNTFNLPVATVALEKPSRLNDPALVDRLLIPQNTWLEGYLRCISPVLAGIPASTGDSELPTTGNATTNLLDNNKKYITIYLD